MPVTVDRDLPLHDERGREWDGDAARSAMADRCSRDDGVMADCMGRGFIWRDPDADPATIGAYDLPVADVIGGDLQLVLSGVQAAANSISPERTPGEARALEASEDDLADMRNAVEAILARFAEHFDDDSLRAPWTETEESTTASAQGGCGCDCARTTETEPTSPAASATTPAQEATVTANETATAADAPASGRDRVLRASAGSDWRPPTEWFANPRLEGPTKLTVTADGRVHGHLAAPWDTPHIGYDGVEIYPPKDADGGLYRGFRRSEVITADGMTVYCGLITMAGGHADPGMGFTAAQEHYDNTCAIVAAVNVGEDEHGIWLAGSMLPDVSADQRTRFSLASISGDWRKPRPGEPFQLIAALSVPNPGFPVLHSADKLSGDRYALAASAKTHSSNGEVVTIIAAGTGVVDQVQVDHLAQTVGDVVDARLAAWMEKQAAAAQSETEAAASGEQAKTEVPTTGGEESEPATEGEPDPEGEAAPAPAAGATETGTGTEAAPSGAADPAAEAEPAPAVQADPPPAEAAPAPEAPSAERIAAAADFLGRVRPAPRAPSALERVLAAAGGGKKA